MKNDALNEGCWNYKNMAGNCFYKTFKLTGLCQSDTIQIDIQLHGGAVRKLILIRIKFPATNSRLFSGQSHARTRRGNTVYMCAQERAIWL